MRYRARSSSPKMMIRNHEGKTLEEAYKDIKMEFEVHVEDEYKDQNKGEKKGVGEEGS